MLTGDPDGWVRMLGFEVIQESNKTFLKHIVLSEKYLTMGFMTKLRHQQPSLWHQGLTKDIEDLWEPWMRLVDRLLAGKKCQRSATCVSTTTIRKALPSMASKRDIYVYLLPRGRLATNRGCHRPRQRSTQLHHSYVIDQAGQQEYEIVEAISSDGDARASPGSTWAENMRMPRRRSLRH